MILAGVIKGPEHAVVSGLGLLLLGIGGVFSLMASGGRTIVLPPEAPAYVTALRGRRARWACLAFGALLIAAGLLLPWPPET